ncbi:UbiD family decarboxylase, partial [Chloroflexota bacterium]
MPFKDVREFITKLEQAGEAQQIEEEVDWNLEAGAMLRRSAEAGLPAPFFQRVQGYPKGYRLFGGMAAKFSRIAIAMDMDPHTHQRELIEEYLLRSERPIEPELVKDGPCKENIHVGDEIDLLEFPVPMIHDGDGGRYIGTWHVTISKDLDSDWVNWGMYRHMLHNKNTLGIRSDPMKHLGGMYSKSYQPRDEPMEVAIAIGVEPISSFCAASPTPYGVSEVGLAGGLRGEPLQLIKCETVNLAVPATAEIVIEGEVRPYERIDEGQFGEFTGYMAGSREPAPVIRVKAVTHRNNPILTMSCMGVPVDDNCIMSVAKGGEFLAALRARGLPVTGVCVPPEAGYTYTIVAVKALYSKIADDIAHVIWGLPIGTETPYLVIVEDDIDPFDMAQVLHAVATKCHPYRGIMRMERTPAAPFLPFLDPHERKNRVGPRVYFDCTWPLEWDPADIPRRSSFAEIYPLEVQQKALTKWQK